MRVPAPPRDCEVWTIRTDGTRVACARFHRPGEPGDGHRHAGLLPDGGVYAWNTGA